MATFVYFFVLRYWMCLLPPFHCVAYCSSVLFNKDKGVLYFLRESVTLDEVMSFH